MIDEEKAGRYLDEIRSLHTDNDRLEAEVERLRTALREADELIDDLMGYATQSWDYKYGDYWRGEQAKIRKALATPAEAQPQATATKIECKHGCGQPLDQHYVERQFKDGRETYSAVKCPISPSD